MRVAVRHTTQRARGSTVNHHRIRPLSIPSRLPSPRAATVQATQTRFAAAAFILALLVSGFGAVAAAQPHVTAVDMGFGHTLALLSDGTVMAWGGNHAGELGDGTLTDRSTPAPVHGLSDVIAVSAGFGHSLAVRADGTVWAWGENGNGQLGLGSTDSSPVPVQVPGLAGAAAVSAGSYFSLALLLDGSVWGWGLNYTGQVGDGSTTQRLSPTQVAGIDDAVAIAAGGFHSVALRRDGTVAAWGLNEDVQLGDGTRRSSRSPVVVPDLSGVTAIGAGEKSTVALMSDGSVWAWGSNADGQLGVGHERAETGRVRVAAVPPASAISVAHESAMVLAADGSVWAWGAGFGSTPTVVQDLAGVELLAAGYRSGLAVAGGGTLYAWGSNTFGQLGTGSTADLVTPETIDVNASTAGGEPAADGAEPGTPAAPEVTATTVTLADGSVLEGELAAEGLVFTTSFGAFEIDLENLADFADGGLTLADGTVLVGSFTAGSWTFTGSLGVFEFDVATVAGVAPGGASAVPPSGGPAAGAQPSPAGVPTEAMARDAFQARVDRVFEPGLGVVRDFVKTDGLSSEVMGVPYYDLEFTATVHYPQGVRPECHPDEFFSWDCFAYNSQVGASATYAGLRGQGWRLPGDSESVVGTISFQRTESGWRPQ